jgi:hypothetical protein
VIRECAGHSLDGLREARLHRGPLAGRVGRQRGQRAPGPRFAAVLRGKIAADESFPAPPAPLARSQRRCARVAVPLAWAEIETIGYAAVRPPTVPFLARLVRP